jgi:hypothetical protein
MSEFRLGDVIDDYCVKCRRIMNHSVVSMVDTQPAKVRCRTCYNDHDYRHELAPPPKVDLRKSALFKEVLEKLPAVPEQAAAAPEQAPAVPEQAPAVPDKAPAVRDKAAVPQKAAAAPEQAATPAKAVKKTRKK